MSKSYPWFRLYSEFAKDPKIQSMSEPMQRRLIMVFCLQCSNEWERLSDDELMFSLGLNNETFHETVSLFQTKGFLDEKRRVRNWMKRQYISDTSTDRVKKFRQKQKVKEMKRFSNATVTPPDTDTDTDTPLIPQGNDVVISNFESIWVKYKPYDMPTKGNKAKALKYYQKAIKKNTHEKIETAIVSYINSCHTGKIKTQHLSTWLNQEGWTTEYEPAKKSLVDIEIERSKRGGFIC